LKYGFYTPIFGDYGDAATLADLAAESEASGWDGFFIWDHLQWPDLEPAVDAWVALTAMAMQTNKIALGPLITPLPRRDIAKLARETVSVDRLSGGRLIMGIGLGWEAIPEWSAFGHEEDAKVRGAMLDEALEVLDALWSGKPVNHVGPYYKAVCEGFAPPLQQPRIPIWIGGQWPGTKPVRRAAKWDGVFPIPKASEGGTLSDGDTVGITLSHDDIVDIKSLLRAAGNTRQDFDIATGGSTADPDDTSQVEAVASAGATWWIEVAQAFSHSLEQVKDRIRQGPPSI
jgi:alkanesulfonate monooxygenase SsuD/methylene tetrahydromethanopterin reductase-like flavin-dependent oxidoreductase (luciferase family)